MSVVYNAFDKTKWECRSGSAVGVCRTMRVRGAAGEAVRGALQRVQLVVLENSRLKKN